MEKMEGNERKPTPIARTTSGVRDLLFDEIDRLRSGISSPAESNAVGRLAQQIVGVSKLEIEVLKASLTAGKKPGETLQLPSISLNGSKQDTAVAQ